MRDMIPLTTMFCLSSVTFFGIKKNLLSVKEPIRFYSEFADLLEKGAQLLNAEGCHSPFASFNSSAMSKIIAA